MFEGELSRFETEEELVSQVVPKESGPRKDWHKLVEAGRPTARKIAYGMRGNFPAHVGDELVAVAEFEMTNAASRFTGSIDEFQKYLPVRIRGAIKDYMRSEDILPRYLRTAVRKIEKITSGQPGIDDEEISRLLNINVEDIRKLKEHIDAGVEHCPDDEEFDWLMMLAYQGWNPEDLLMEKQKRDFTNLATGHLTAKEAAIVRMYSEGKFMREIGEVMNLSEPRVSQLYTRARKKMTEWMKGNIR